MNFSNSFFMYNRLMVFMNNVLLRLMDHILVMLNYDILVVLMDNVSMVFLNYRWCLMSLYSSWNHLSIINGGHLFSSENGLFLMSDYLRH